MLNELNFSTQVHMESYSKIRAYLLEKAKTPDASSSYKNRITEEFLQHLWFGRKLSKKLQTIDGEELEIIQPGFWNHESGPDFKNAVIKLNGQLLTGDIEIHIHQHGWHTHRHDLDPLYDSVILHAAYYRDSKERFAQNSRNEFIPQMIIENQTLVPVEFLLDDDEPSLPRSASLPHYTAGHCAETIRAGQKTLLEILDHAGHQRFLEKAARWERLAKATSLRQALWEGLCEALGYKNNKLPMRLLARRVSGIFSTKKLNEKERIAIMTGASGFLSHSMTDKDKSPDFAYIRELWDIWWKHRAQFAPDQASTGLWRMDAVRPVNHPHRRVAAAAFMWAFLPKLEKAIRSFPASLDDMSTFPMEDPYWSFHYTLGGKRAKAKLPLIGQERWNQIRANILYPLAHTFAKTPSVQKNVFAQFARLPAKENDFIIRAACQRLDISPADVKGMTRKQGLHQIYQDFCLADRSDCQKCPFPKFVDQWEKK